jgi:hypothetical protein
MESKRTNAHPGGGEEKQPAPAKVAAGRRIVLLSCWVLLAALGWLDYVTGYELSFFVFYSLPVGIAAWYAGRWPAVGVAVGATAAWLLASYFGGEKYSARFYYYWNSSIHFLAFVINAVSIAKIKSDLDRRHLLAAELDSVRKTLRAFSALWPACAGCGKPRDGVPHDHVAAAVTLAKVHPDASALLCADCRAKAAQEIANGHPENLQEPSRLRP